MDRFETARAYADNIQAELARAHLEANGIEAMVVEAAGYNPMLNAALGIELRVPSRDVEQARRMLATLDAQVEADSDAEDAADDDTVRCPMCESEYCYYEGPGPEGHYGAHPFAAVAKMVGTFGEKRWRCRKCKHEWYDEAEGHIDKTRIAKGSVKPVFRFYRGNPGLGIFLGIVFGLVVSIIWPKLGIIVTVLGVVAGWLIGRAIGADVCSEPNCRHVLGPDDDECPGCKGVISGRIQEAHEHFRMATDVRRELAAALEEEEEQSAKRVKKKRNRKKARANQPSSIARSPRRTIPTIAIMFGIAIVLGGIYVAILDRSPAKSPTKLANPLNEPGPVAKSEVLEGKSAGYRITVTNPAAWKRYPPASHYDMALEHQASGASIVISVGPMENEFLTVDDVADASLHVIKASSSSFKVESRELLDNKASALLIRASNSKDGKSTDNLLTFFVQDGSAYVVEGVVPPSQYLRMRAEMEAMIRSFTLPPAKPLQTTLPKPVLNLPAPPAPSAQYQGFDLATQKPMVLAVQAQIAHGKKQSEASAQLWHWANVRGHVPSKYNLACAYSRLDQKDAAFYWVERAAAEEGIDPNWAEEDLDLEVLRKDPRWSTLRPYLLQATRYWQHSGGKETLLIVPKGYKPGKPIPLVIGLHGYGSIPRDFADEQLQRIADAKSVAFVSVSGTIPLGPHSYRWAESISQDKKHIDAALAEVSNRVTFSPEQTILIGFSEGAQMAAAIAARYPDQYAGAIAMSPGTRRDLSLNTVERMSGIEKRRFVIVAGAGENPMTVATAKQDAERLRSFGAEVLHKEYENQKEHSFPADYEKALPEWIRYILGSGVAPK